MRGVSRNLCVRAFSQIFEAVLIGGKESVGVADVSLRIGAFACRRVDLLKFL
jgi:hypothetical protein